MASAVREVEARVTAYFAGEGKREARAAIEAEAAARTVDEADITLAVLNQAEEATALELTRTRGVGGALTALKDNWVAELVDITKVPVAYLQVNDATVRAAIRSGVRDIPGLRIVNEAKAMIR